MIQGADLENVVCVLSQSFATLFAAILKVATEFGALYQSRA